MTNWYEMAFLTDLLLLDHILGSGSGQRGRKMRGLELAGGRRRCRFHPGSLTGRPFFQKKAQAPRQRASLGQHSDPGEHHVSRPGGQMGEGHLTSFEYFVSFKKSVT